MIRARDSAAWLACEQGHWIKVLKAVMARRLVARAWSMVSKGKGDEEGAFVQ